MKRLSNIFRAKASRAIDAAEDPRETLDYSYEKQLDLLQQMRRGVTDVATSRKRLELQAQDLAKQGTKLEDQARRAMEQGREDLAREALTRREAIVSQLDDLRSQHEQLKAQEQKLVTATQRLEAKVQAFRQRKETMKANYSAAEAETKINEAVSGISEEMGDIGLSMRRAEDKIAQMQARSSALEGLMQSGALEDLTGSSDPIEAELERGVSQSNVELELQRLKGELGSGGSSAKQLEPSEGEDRS